MSELESQNGSAGFGPSEPEQPGGLTPATPHEPLPPKRKSRIGTFFLGAFTGCLFVFVAGFFLLVMAVAIESDSGTFSFGEKVAVIPIEGEIFEARDTVDLLRHYAQADSVKAMVVRINSPGGAIAPSQEIYSAIRQIRESSGKPIVASLDSVAASGGLYIAAACDEIVANPGSITGSIGVILQWFDMKDLVKWAKLKPETITSGTLKDAGSPYRELTEAERQYFKGIVAQLHSQFVRDVARGREGKMKADEVARIADGRIFTGEQALQIKLVDRLGSIDDAVRIAAKRAGIKGEPKRVWPRRRDEVGLLDLLNDDADSLLERVVSRRVPQFLYRW